MSKPATKDVLRPARSFEEAVRRAPEVLRYQIATMSKEELAEKLTTYEPGVPHYWFGRPVEPLTKEELLAHGNGGAESEIPHKNDALEPKAEREKKIEVR